MKTYKSVLLTLVLFIISGFISTPLVQQVQAASTPELTTYFTPSPWVAPGNPVTVTTEVVNTDPSADLTDATVHLTIVTGNQYDPVFVTSDYGYTCVRTSSGRYSTPQYDCSGATIPAGQVASIVYKVQTPDIVNYANTRYSATSSVAAYSVSSSDSVLIAPYYAPDLAVSLVASKQNVVLGDSLTYTVKAYNGGYLPSEATTMDVTFPDGSTTSIDIPALPAKEFSPSSSFTYTPTTLGANTISAVVDPANVVVENSEDNNTSSNTVMVNAVMPDLVTSMSSPLSVPVKLNFQETATVKNQGTGSAANIVLSVIFSGTYRFGGVGTITANHGFTCAKTTFKRFTQVYLTGYQCNGGSLAAGESATINANIIAPYYAGTYYTNSSVDPSHLVTESDETNNTNTWMITAY